MCHGLFSESRSIWNASSTLVSAMARFPPWVTTRRIETELGTSVDRPSSPTSLRISACERLAPQQPEAARMADTASSWKSLFTTVLSLARRDRIKTVHVKLLYFAALKDIV